MKRIILCISLLYCCCFNIEAQLKKNIDKQMELMQLNITDSNVVKAINFIMLGKGQMSKWDKNSFYFYTLFIKKDTVENIFLLELSILPPDIADKSTNVGFFYINDTPIIVNGCNAYNLFEETDTKYQFNYTYQIQIINGKEYTALFPEEFASWFFLYAHKALFPIYLPEKLIYRLGFVPCE